MPTVYTLQVGDEVFDIEGPDNATDEQLRAFADEYVAQNKQGSFAPAQVKRTRGDEAFDAIKGALPEGAAGAVDGLRSFGEGLDQGFTKVFDNAARALETGAEWVGLDDPEVDAVSAAAAEREAARSSNYNPSTAGRIVGEIGATLPAMVLRGGALVQGGVASALMTDERTLGGVAKDSAIGAAAGKAGELALRGVGRLAAPVVGDRVRRLIDQGVRLTPGQIAGQSSGSGRAIKRLEDSVANLPVVGTSIRDARRRGVEDLNRTQTNRALEPIGKSLPDNIETGQDAVAYAGNQLSQAYQDVLPKLSGTIDSQYSRRLATIMQRADLPPEYQAQLASIMKESSNAFTGRANGQYTGRTLRDASERLEDLAKAWRVSDDPYLRRAGEVAGEARTQLHSLARRQNPTHATQLRAIDRGWASLVRTEKAAAGTADGVFSGPQLRSAVRQADRSTRKRSVSRGEALDQRLADDASMVMPSTVGEGGSNAVNGLAILGGLGAGAAGGAPGAAAFLGAGAAGMAAYTPKAQQIIQYLMARQAGATGNAVNSAARNLAPYAAVVAPATLEALRNVGM